NSRAEKEREGVCEARNEEVIRRVAELQRLVEDAENYLSDADGETTETESVRSDQYGRLKHSDSLLLLTQGQKLLPNGEVVESEERSGSDTDSQSTPSQSPAHRPAPGKAPQRPSSVLKPSGSSFGLHSPDNLPLNLQAREDDIRALIRQLEDNSGLPYTFAEGTLYLDPDIIDLTMIPPPITPDEDGAKVFPPQVSTPPTPFADRETLEKELKDLERDLGNLKSLTDPAWLDHEALANLSDSNVTGASDTEDSVSLSSLNTSTTSDHSSTVSGRVQGGPSQSFTLAALRQLGIFLEEGEDIDSFIANLTIPPPPEGSVDLQAYAETRRMGGGEYDISAFIIPPPPTSDEKDNRSSDIIRRLYEAKEGISKMVCEDGSDLEGGGEKDQEVGEVRVSSETVAKPGKVASLQRRFENPTHPTQRQANPSATSNRPGGQLNNTNCPGMDPRPAKDSDSSGYDSLRSNTSGQELDARLAMALEENDRMFRTFERKKMSSGSGKGDGEGNKSGGSDTRGGKNARSDGNSEGRPSVMSQVRLYGSGNVRPGYHSLQRPSTLQRQATVPTGHTQSTQDDESPPPPPPRTPVTRTGTLTHPRKMVINPPGSRIQRSMSVSTGNLAKSASHGDVSLKSGLKSPVKSPGIASASTEDVTLRSPSLAEDVALHRSLGSSSKNSSSSSTEDVHGGSSKASPGSPSKQSMASSNDSLTSSSSVVTVKSASLGSLDQDDEPQPPELPPRTPGKPSTRPPLPRTPSQDNVKGLTSVRSPSPSRNKSGHTPSPDTPERPPSVPSRLRKPQLSPTSTTATLPATHRPRPSAKLTSSASNTLGKPLAPSPTSPKSGTISPRGGTTSPRGGTTSPRGGTTSPRGGTTSPRSGTTSPRDAASPRSGQSPQKSPKAVRKASITEDRPQLPAKTSQQSPSRRAPAPTPTPATNGMRSPVRTTEKNPPATSRLPRPDTSNVALKNSINQEAPLQTSSPKLSPKTRLVNGKAPHGADPDDSLDSGSFDQDSLEEAEDLESMPPASREAFRNFSSVVSQCLAVLTELAGACAEAQRSGRSLGQDETKFQEARESLTSESRQFVTASKLFVKSATESEETLLNCLASCVVLMQAMVDVSKGVVQYTSTPLQTQNVVARVRDVATTYQATVRAALSAAGRGMDHPSMNTLMTQATNLAGVLTALMRTLRVFSP
ncbi:hypothetical protein Pmani_038278, partial [Petrolisthes manimaculis]